MERLKKGFTLLEVLIAILVITFGVLASYSVVQRIFIQTFSSENRLTAIYLAEEGLELVRQVRDSRYLNGTSASVDFLINCVNPGRYCELDSTNQGTDPAIINSSTPPRKLKIGNNLYNYTTGTDSKFTRKIEVFSWSPPSENLDFCKIVVTVSWQERGQTHSVRAEEILSDWI